MPTYRLSDAPGSISILSSRIDVHLTSIRSLTQSEFMRPVQAPEGPYARSEAYALDKVKPGLDEKLGQKKKIIFESGRPGSQLYLRLQFNPRTGTVIGISKNGSRRRDFEGHVSIFLKDPVATLNPILYSPIKALKYLWNNLLEDFMLFLMDKANKCMIVGKLHPLEPPSAISMDMLTKDKLELHWAKNEISGAGMTWTNVEIRIASPKLLPSRVLRARRKARCTNIIVRLKRKDPSTPRTRETWFDHCKKMINTTDEVLTRGEFEEAWVAARTQLRIDPNTDIGKPGRPYGSRGKAP